MSTPSADGAWNDVALGIPVEAQSWQSKARCFYTDTGVLMVEYEDMPSMEMQGWDAAPADGYYYTSEAVSTQHCATCNRTFASVNAVLQHLRDHASHRDRPESYEAAYVIKCQEEGYCPPAIPAAWSPHADFSMQMMPMGMNWPQYSAGGEYPMWGGQQGEEFQVMAPPSDIYTGSETGSGTPPEDTCDGTSRHVSSGVTQPSTPDKTPATHGHEHHAPRSTPAGKPARTNRAGRPTHHSRSMQAPPPRPEDETAFPPLPGSAGGKAATNKGLSYKWTAAVNSPVASPTAASGSHKLRADAVEYQPCGAAPASVDSPAVEAVESPATPVVSSVVEAVERPATSVESPAVEAVVASSQSDTVVTPNTPKQVLRVSAPAWAPPSTNTTSTTSAVDAASA